MIQNDEQHDHGQRDQRHHEQAIAGEEEDIGCSKDVDSQSGTAKGRVCGPQMKRVPSSIMKARPKVSSRL